MFQQPCFLRFVVFQSVYFKITSNHRKWKKIVVHVLIQYNFIQLFTFCQTFIMNFSSLKGLSCPWSYSSWIYNYLCHQCISSLMWVRILIRARCTTLCDKICQWLDRSVVISNNKTDHHNITEILLKVALNTIKPKHLLFQLAWILNERSHFPSNIFYFMTKINFIGIKMHCIIQLSFNWITIKLFWANNIVSFESHYIIIQIRFPELLLYRKVVFQWLHSFWLCLKKNPNFIINTWLIDWCLTSTLAVFQLYCIINTSYQLTVME